MWNDYLKNTDILNQVSKELFWVVKMFRLIGQWSKKNVFKIISRYRHVCLGAVGIRVLMHS